MLDQSISLRANPLAVVHMVRSNLAECFKQRKVSKIRGELRERAQGYFENCNINK